MKTIFKIFLVGLLFTFYSCEDFFSTTVEIDPPERIAQLAVTAFWNNTDENLTVFVDGTSDIFSGRTFQQDTVGLAGATVELFVDGSKYGTFVPIPDSLDLWFSNEGSYILQLNEAVGLLGTEFELKVSHPDYPSASSKQRFPTTVTPSEYKHLSNAGTDQYGYPTKGVEMKFQDPSSESNFYEVGLFFKDSFDLYYPGEFQYYFQQTYNSTLDPNAVMGPNYNDLFVNDSGFDGQDYKLLVQYEDFGDTSNDLIVMFNNISEDKYRFATSLRAYYDSSDFGPFSEPVPLYSNMENGLGCFGLGSIVIKELQL